MGAELFLPWGKESGWRLPLLSSSAGMKSEWKCGANIHSPVLRHGANKSNFLSFYTNRVVYFKVFLKKAKCGKTLTSDYQIRHKWVVKIQ